MEFITKIKHYLKTFVFFFILTTIVLFGYLYLASIEVLPFLSPRMVVWADRLGF